MTDSEYTDITMIVDRSGSMAAIKDDTEGGFNTFIADQAKLPGITKVSLVQFDDKYDVGFIAADISRVQPLQLIPRGTTALLDAIGKTVAATGERLAALPEDKRPGHVIIVVLTDGQENSSKEWRRERVFEDVRRQREEFSWTFIFMGADQNAITEAAMMGFNQDLSLAYAGAHVTNAFASTSAAVSRSRRGEKAGYTSDERSAAVGGGGGSND